MQRGRCLAIIDLENDIYDYVAKRIRAAHTGAYVVGEYVETPAKFPAVTLVEADNRVLTRMRTSDDIENGVSVMWDMNIYSNKTAGKKAEAKAIANTADAVFAEIGFTRTFREQVPNLNNATIYRIVCRYEAVIDKDFVIYHSE